MQIHDFNPGITASGLFWTLPIPRERVSFNLGKATASISLDNLAMPDYHDILNSLGATKPPVPPVASTVSFDVRWQGKAKRVGLRDTTNHFSGLFVDSTATIVWSASQPATHFTFASGPAASSTTISAVMGRERNGRFFGDGHEDDG
jgi:hypothetical protein